MLRSLCLTMLLVSCASFSGCAMLADSLLTEERARGFATKALEVVGPAVKDLVTDRLLAEADKRGAADREKLLAAAAKRGVQWKDFDYNGNGAIEVGGEYLDLLRAVETAAESSGLPLTPGETGGAATTILAMAALWLENRRKKTARKDAEDREEEAAHAGEEADVAVRGVKSLRKKAMMAKVLIGDKVVPLAELPLVHEGQQYVFDQFVRSVMRTEAADAGIQDRMHERVKRVAG